MKGTLGGVGEHIRQEVGARACLAHSIQFGDTCTVPHETLTCLELNTVEELFDFRDIKDVTRSLLLHPRFIDTLHLQPRALTPATL